MILLETLTFDWTREEKLHLKKKTFNPTDFRQQTIYLEQLEH